MLRFMRFSITAPIDTNHMWPLMLLLISRLCLRLLFLGSQRSNLLKLYGLKSLILNSMILKYSRIRCLNLKFPGNENFPLKTKMSLIRFKSSAVPYAAIWYLLANIDYYILLGTCHLDFQELSLYGVQSHSQVVLSCDKPSLVSSCEQNEYSSAA